MSDHAHDAPAEHGPSHDSAQGDPTDHSHGASLTTYLIVFVALCILTTGSFMTWTHWWRDVFSSHAAWAFMMAISCCKALLVILFFMHLKYEANWKYVLTIPAGFMSVFLALMLVPDIGMRFWHYSRDRLEFTALPAAVEEHAAPVSPTPAASPGHSAPHR